VSFYYCYASDGETLETIVAEVNNTPWNEQYCYVLPRALNMGRGSAWRFRPEKKMHVSPFIGMDVDYDWTFTQPADRLTVFMAASREQQRFFEASMNMLRTEITGRALARVLFAYPFMTVKVIVTIHWQALRLWWKRCPIYPHPRKRSRLLSEQ
jgi:DUF1365 family protein